MFCSVGQGSVTQPETLNVVQPQTQTETMPLVHDADLSRTINPVEESESSVSVDEPGSSPFRPRGLDTPLEATRPEFFLVLRDESPPRCEGALAQPAPVEGLGA